MYNELKGYFKSEGVNEDYMHVQLYEENKTEKHMKSRVQSAVELKKSARKPKPKKKAVRAGCRPALK